MSNAEWVKTDIDRFVLARLEREGLQPVKPADRRTLIRRATLDLTGLPPTAEEVDAFVADTAPDAFAKVVDRLLASPRYGEAGDGTGSTSRATPRTIRAASIRCGAATTRIPTRTSIATG